MNIDVVGRIRPSLRGEGPVSLEIDGGNRVSARQGGAYFSFTDLHKQEASNYDIYQTAVEPLVDFCVAGFNTCLIITGEKGSGKGYAAAGESASKSGIVPIIIENLFAKIGDDSTYMYDSKVSENNRVYMQMYEVYNELIKDLAAVPGVQSEFLDVEETADKGARVKNINTVPLVGGQDGLAQFRQAWARRTNTHTDFGDATDLSTIVIQFEITLRPQESPLPNRSKLTVIVTPGTDKLAQDSSEIRMREGPNLSRSMVSLSQLVATLANQNFPDRVVNYNDSKLTALLRDELGGNCKTRALVCMRPQADSNVLAATLRFSSQLSEIKNYPIINDLFSQHLLTQYRARIMSYQEQLGGAGGLPNPTAIHDMGGESRRVQTENLQLRDKNERLHLKLDQIQGTFTTLAHTKTDLSAQLLMTEEEKLTVSKTLVEMQIENNKIREESEAVRFELTNRILQLENDLVEMEMGRDKYAKAARNAKERLSEVEKDRKDLADEYVTLKSNYMALVKGHEKEVGRNEELSTELMNMVNAKAALMRRLDRQLDGHGGAESPNAEVDRVRAIVSRLQYRKLTDNIKGSKKDRENLERSLFGDQKRYEGQLDRVKHEYEDDYRKLSSKVRALQSELHEARRQARERGKQVSELNAQLISSRNWKENLETQNNRMQHKLKDVNDEFRSRLVKYVEDIATYIDHGGVPDKHKDDHHMKEYVTKMLSDLKRAHKIREEQLSQAAQNARSRCEEVVRKHEELLVAYRNLRHSAEVRGYDDLDLGPDETKIQMGDSELVSKQQAEINRLREDLNQATNELESFKLRMRMGDYSDKDMKGRPGLVKDKSWGVLRKQLHEFTINTQDELEAERAELLSKNAMLEQELRELQEYIDVHLGRYKEEIIRLRTMLNMEGDGFNSPGPAHRSKKR